MSTEMSESMCGNNLLLCVVLFLCTPWSLSARGEILLRSVGFSQPPGTDFALKNHLLRTVYGVRSAKRCLAGCLRDSLCVAVNYEEGPGTCELSGGKWAEFPGDGIRVVGWRYYEKDSGVVENAFPPPTTSKVPTTKMPTTEAPTTEAPTTEVPTTVYVSTEKPPVDCWDIHDRSPTSPSGEYVIYPQLPNSATLEVYCDMTTDGGGWIVFQRRVDASQDFYLDWNSYKVGFGDVGGSFWLGNDALNVLTTQGDYRLLVELESYGSVKTFAKYGQMKVANEVDKYRLNVTGFYGSYTTGDSLTYHSGRPFTTKDVDNDDDDERQCAQAAQGGWWYGACSYCNLNGPYQASATVFSKGIGVTWASWLGQENSLKFTEMKIRPMNAQPVPKDCWDHYESGSASTGMYTIFVKGRPEGLDVLCDMDFDGGGWTTLQTRSNGDVDFYRDWADYKAGFGTVGVDSDFWLGLDDIYLLTNQDDYQIRIVFVSWQEVLAYARYSEFRIGNEADNYRLTISGYSGTGGDSMTSVHNGMPWSTRDRDNDNDDRHCAQAMLGAWWYNNCQTSNLNGPYVAFPGYLSTNGHGIIWSSWLGQDDSMARVQMKIRPTRIGYS